MWRTMDNLSLGSRGRSANARNHTPRSKKPTTHPATVINQMLLSRYPNAKVAISHDNEWCAVIREDEIAMPDTSELLNRIQQTFILHLDDDGTAYLSQEHAPEANSQRQSPSPDGFVTVPEHSECAQETLSKAAGDVHDEDGKISARAQGEQSEGPPKTVLSGNVIKCTSEPVSEDIPKPVIKDIPEPDFENIPEPVIKRTSEPVSKDIPELVITRSPEPFSTDTPDPVFEDILGFENSLTVTPRRNNFQPSSGPRLFSHANLRPRNRDELRRTQFAKPQDDLLADAHEGDIIVPVIGPTGAGKSTFINNYLNVEYAARVGHSLESCTEVLQAFLVPLPQNRRLVLVDTPGFDDTNKTDAEILKRIAIWLASSYGPGKTCGGLIYLHDMSDARMRGPTLQNLKVFQRLCGKKNLRSVVFGTTKSGKLPPATFARREKELSDRYRKDFKKKGAIVFKLLPSHKSADELVGTVLDRVGDEERVLRIQQELVGLYRTLPTTKAGQELRYSLQEIMEYQKKALAGEELTDEQIAMYKNKIAGVAPQLKELTRQLSFSQPLLMLFGQVE